MDNFHSAKCALRYNGKTCTCGLDERIKDEEFALARLKAKKDAKEHPGSAIKELIYDVINADNSGLCLRAEDEYSELASGKSGEAGLASGKCGEAALVYTSKSGEELRELVKMARVIARGYIYEVGVDNAPAPEEPAEDIVDMAFKVLEGSWITRTYDKDKKKELTNH